MIAFRVHLEQTYYSWRRSFKGEHYVFSGDHNMQVTVIARNKSHLRANKNTLDFSREFWCPLTSKWWYCKRSYKSWLCYQPHALSNSTNDSTSDEWDLKQNHCLFNFLQRRIKVTGSGDLYWESCLWLVKPMYQTNSKNAKVLIDRFWVIT